MAGKNRSQVSDAAVAAARQRAEETRKKLAGKPSPSELLTPQERADAAPFYFVLREYIRQLKEARESAGLTLAELSARTGMAVEYLSRLETGAQTNPTWKTLGSYAKAIGGRPQLALEVSAPQAEMPSVDLVSADSTPARSIKTNGMKMESASPVMGSTRSVSKGENLARRQYRRTAATVPPFTFQAEELVS
jgi:transcriptional regulator with XRE-family HTH domain